MQRWPHARWPCWLFMFHRITGQDLESLDMSCMENEVSPMSPLKVSEFLIPKDSKHWSKGQMQGVPPSSFPNHEPGLQGRMNAIQWTHCKHAIGKMNGECTKRQILHFDQIHHWVRVKTGTKSALASIHGYLGRCPPILMLVNFRFEYNLQSNHPQATKPRSRKRNFRVCDTTWGERSICPVPQGEEMRT